MTGVGIRIAILIERIGMSKPLLCQAFVRGGTGSSDRSLGFSIFLF